MLGVTSLRLIVRMLMCCGLLVVLFLRRRLISYV